MIEDITTTIKAQLYDRITSPLSGTFALSWIVWNWRFVVILLSDLKAPEKISYINFIIFPRLEDIFLHGVLLPLITTIALITIYPIPAKWFYRIAQGHKKSLKGIQQTIEDETPMTLQEAADLRRALKSLQSQHEKELAEKTTELAERKDLQHKAESHRDDLEEELKQASLRNSELTNRASASASELEITMGQLRHLSGFTCSVIPHLIYTPNTKQVRKSEIMDGTENGALASVPRPNVDDIVENAIQHHIDANGLLQSYSPKIFSGFGRIYLQTTKNQISNFIIGTYKNNNYQKALEEAKTIIQILHDHDLKSL